MGGALAKKRAAGGRPKGARPPREKLIGVKVGEEYGAWFARLLDHCRDEPGFSTLTAAGLIETALALLAEREKFEPPPRR